ncbi:hypothetical protein LCGC14_0483040 [marine sediment metagenome]|uniref:Uncharacterized protein n=1 Tax=marine sediment metagenome TaxID=412755 RepID=A0A0F9UVY9_9ZZZZ
MAKEENLVEQEEQETKEPVRFNSDDAKNLLVEESQRNVADGAAEVQEVLDRRNLRISVSMTSFEDGRNVPNIQLVPRQDRQG